MTPGDPAPFSIDAHEHDGYLHVTPGGELDLATTPELEELVMGRLQERESVVVDLRKLEFMDSTGVRALVTAHAAAKESGARLVIVRPARESPVDRVIEVSGIAEALAMVDDVPA